MWTAPLHPIDQRTTRFVVSGHAGPLSFREVIAGWCERAEFREFFATLISESPGEAFFWETPPVTDRTLDQPFEGVLVQALALAGLSADPAPFQARFAAEPDAEVLTFANLGGDAVLVVPAPRAEDGCYVHLARFLRTAPRPQVDAFWQSVGRAMRQRVSSRPTWLSTAGLGVAWLHLRLDTSPKYYRHAPYRGGE